MNKTLQPIPWAKHSLGKVIETGGWVNHIVLKRDGVPPLGKPAWHWLARTFDGGVQIGFSLSTPVRVDQFADGGEPNAAIIAYLDDVVSLLEETYEATRVLRYMNPEYKGKEVKVEQNVNVGPRSLQQLTTREQRQRHRGRRVSTAKTAAARESIAMVNHVKQAEAEERAERYLALRKGGLTLQEIADRDGVSLNAVKCALKRARRALEAEEHRMGDQRAAWVERLAESKATRQAITQEQQEFIARFGEPSAFHEDGSITIAIDDGDSVRVAR